MINENATPEEKNNTLSSTLEPMDSKDVESCIESDEVSTIVKDALTRVKEASTNIKAALDQGQHVHVVYRLEGISSVTHEEARRLLYETDSTYVGVLAKYPEKLTGFTYDEIARILLERRRFYDLALELDKFKHLSRFVGHEMIKVGGARFVKNNIASFDDKDYLLQYILEYENREEELIAVLKESIIKGEEAIDLEYYFKKLDQFSAEILIKILIEKQLYKHLRVLAFAKGNFKQIAQSLSKMGHDDEAGKYLDKSE